MTRRLALLSLASLGAALAGCGFRPLHGTSTRGGAVSVDLSAIEVGLLQERTGQLLRLSLQEMLDPRGAAPPARYDLDVIYAVEAEGLAFRRNDAASRIRLVGTASWVLRRRLPDRPEVGRGVTRAVDAFNVFDDAPFAAELVGDANQRRLADQVAAQIVERLAVLLRDRAA